MEGSSKRVKDGRHRRRKWVTKSIRNKGEKREGRRAFFR